MQSDKSPATSTAFCIGVDGQMESEQSDGLNAGIDADTETVHIPCNLIENHVLRKTTTLYYLNVINVLPPRQAFMGQIQYYIIR